MALGIWVNFKDQRWLSIMDLGIRVSYNGFGYAGEAYWDDSFDFGYVDAISIDKLSEPLSWENQWLGKRKLLEEAENPCGKNKSMREKLMWKSYLVLHMIVWVIGIFGRGRIAVMKHSFACCIGVKLLDLSYLHNLVITGL